MVFKNGLDALILAALKEGPLHGYAIAKTIRSVSNEALKFGEGQLYPTLHRLEREGAVRAEWEPQEGKPPRKVYAITDKGGQALGEQAKAWRRFSDGFEAVLHGARPKPEAKWEANHA